MPSRIPVPAQSLLLALPLLFASQAPLACSCAHDSAEAIFDRHPHAFLARITSVEDRDPRSIPERLQQRDFDRSDYGVNATFAVEALIKGDPGSIESLTTGYGGGDCGLGLRPGDVALVVTSDGSVSYCSLGRVMAPIDCRLLRLIDSMRQRHLDGSTKIRWMDGPPPRNYWSDDAVISAIRNGDNPFEVPLEACAEPEPEPEPESGPAVDGDCSGQS